MKIKKIKLKMSLFQNKLLSTMLQWNLSPCLFTLLFKYHHKHKTFFWMSTIFVYVKEGNHSRRVS